jgi:hypothetical protein
MILLFIKSPIIYINTHVAISFTGGLELLLHHTLIQKNTLIHDTIVPYINEFERPYDNSILDIYI